MGRLYYPPWKKTHVNLSFNVQRPWVQIFYICFVSPNIHPVTLWMTSAIIHQVTGSTTFWTPVPHILCVTSQTRVTHRMYNTHIPKNIPVYKIKKKPCSKMWIYFEVIFLFEQNKTDFEDERSTLNTSNIYGDRKIGMGQGVKHIL